MDEKRLCIVGSCLCTKSVTFLSHRIYRFLSVFTNLLPELDNDVRGEFIVDAASRVVRLLRGIPLVALSACFEMEAHFGRQRAQMRGETMIA